MATAVKTTVTELPESRVRVEAEVPAAEVERQVERTASQLGREMKIPGFRKGKVPAPIVIRRVGRPAVLDQAVRDTLGRWYADAIGEAGIHPIGDPQLDLSDLPGEGQPLRFSVEIGVRPKAKLGDYRGVEVGRREPQADDAAVQAELDELRDRGARLETVDRAAGSGDFVVMDYEGSIDGEPFEGGAGRDEMIELGSGRLIPGFEEQLDGAKAGEERTLKVKFPDDYGAEHLAGNDAEFAASVKEVKERVLPELDDDFAVDQAGFDSLDELRDDIATKLLEADERRVEQAFREAVVDAVVAESTVDVPEALVDARARELWERMLHTLAHQGISKEAYLRIAGREEEDLLEEAKPDAEQALRREAVIAAVVEGEDIHASDGDILDALQASAERESVKVEKLRDQLEKAGRLDDVRADLASRRAVDLLVEAATPISVEQAQARGHTAEPGRKLWTPETEPPAGTAGEVGGRGSGGQIWTPGGSS